MLTLPLTLTTPARTSSPTGTSEHVARIEKSRHSGKPVLVIDGTPGRWEIEQIAGKGDRIAIDFGARWILDNLGELLGELRRLVTNDLIINHG